MTRAVNKLAEIGSSGSRIGFVLVSDPVLTYSAFHLGEHNTLSDNIDAINDVDNNNGNVDQVVILSYYSNFAKHHFFIVM